VFVIGEAARQSGVAIETIRYCEREGITSKAGRSPSGWRVYDSAGIAELRFIKRCRDLGFPIAHIRTLLSLSGQKGAACFEVAELGQRHLDDVRRKIAGLRLLEGALVELVAGFARRTTECAMLERLKAD
jgi:DNA-binding transcriptional MerR regulator